MASALANHQKLPNQIYELNNVKVYDINKSDPYITRYELQTTNGRVLVDFQKSTLLLCDDDSGAATAATAMATQKYTYLNVNLNLLDLNRIKIENKKLIFYLKFANAKHLYGIESSGKSNLSDLSGLCDVLLRSELKNDDKIKRLCSSLEIAIRNGVVDDAIATVVELSRLKCSLAIQPLDGSNDHAMVVETVKPEETDVDDNKSKMFSVECVIIKDDNQKNKNIYLENLSLNMEVNELKQKVFTEFKIPQEQQIWIINNTSCDNDQTKIGNFIDRSKPLNKSIFHLFLLNTTSNMNIEDVEVQNWTCLKCTFINPIDVSKCTICDHAGPQDVANAQDSVVFNEDIIIIDDVNMMDTCTDSNSKLTLNWPCQVCTFLNDDTVENCKLCGETIPHRYRKNIKSEEILSNYLAAYTIEITENTQQFRCDICMDDNMAPGTGVVLKECLHVFCKDCLREHILHSDDSIVKCPYSRDYMCQSSLLEREIRALLNEDEYKKFQVKCLKEGEAKIENTFHCKTPDCIGFCICEDNLNFFYCPVCEQTNCIKCDCIHMGKTCDEYKEDIKIKDQNDKASQKDKAALEKMIKDGVAMNCPKCKIIVLKDVGCDWLQCLVCKTEICWATRGPRWGPKGRGDTTGGCKCEFMRKKCAPNCQNCH